MEKSAFQVRMRDGNTVPAFDADHDLPCELFRSDDRKATVLDPWNCALAKGLCRYKYVLDAHIGCGDRAWIFVKATVSRPFVHALHYSMPIKTQRARDIFETDKKIKSQIVILKAPGASRTLQALRDGHKRRQEAIKNGAPIKKLGKKIRTRMTRLGVPNRPHLAVESIT